MQEVNVPNPFLNSGNHVDMKEAETRNPFLNSGNHVDMKEAETRNPFLKSGNHVASTTNMKKVKAKTRIPVFGDYALGDWDNEVMKRRMDKKIRKASKKNVRFEELIPSSTGCWTFDHSCCAERFSFLNEVATCIKDDLGKHIDTDTHLGFHVFLCESADKVIHSVAHYLEKTKPQPKHWLLMGFVKLDKRVPTEYLKDEEDILWTTYKNTPSLCDLDSILFERISPKWNVLWPRLKRMFPTRTRKLGSSYIARAIAHFAVDAFNEACEMYVKKGVHTNLHDIELKSFTYRKIATNGFLFQMVIEAIEEGNLGVYEAEVLCRDDGSRSLMKFVLSDRKPIGTKAMAISLLSCARLFCETLICDTREKERDLAEVFNQERGFEKGKIHGLLMALEQEFDATMKGLHIVLSLGLRLLFSPNCNQTTNPDVWSHPDNHFVSGMVLRPEGTPCRGYDYINSAY